MITIPELSAYRSYEAWRTRRLNQLERHDREWNRKSAIEYWNQIQDQLEAMRDLNKAQTDQYSILYELARDLRFYIWWLEQLHSEYTGCVNCL